ncbi:MAG: MFS transporter [Chitinophagaceae bacterium]|nr:MFS transporter [Chitinophagaceae bacterium]
MYNKNRVFAAACIGLFLFGMTLITLGSILPELKSKFETEGLSASMLAAILPVGILLGSLVFGPVVDRYGYKLLLIISVLVSVIALEGLAFSKSVTVLYLCIFFVGFGGGIINGGTSALVADISTENKGASLSLLGVSFGAGALGMPLLLGILSKQFEYPAILSAVGLFMLLPVIYFFIITFPPPKQALGFPITEGVKLLKEPALLLTGFFLFFQSGVESLINNWTTTFLQNKLAVTPEKALYALSFQLVGLTVARLLLGRLLKKFSSLVVLTVSLLLIAVSNLVMYNTSSYNVAFIALILTGAGLAGGFPVILGYIGQLYARLSGTAFSIAFVIALTGNTIINYSFGLVQAQYGIQYLPVAMVLCIICMLIVLFVIRNNIASRVKL